MPSFFASASVGKPPSDLRVRVIHGAHSFRANAPFEIRTTVKRRNGSQISRVENCLMNEVASFPP